MVNTRSQGAVDSDGSFEECLVSTLVITPTTPTIVSSVATSTNVAADSNIATSSISTIVSQFTSSNQTSSQYESTTHQYTQSPDVEYRIILQNSRLRLLQNNNTEFQHITHHDISLPMTTARLKSINELWANFSLEHERFAETCSPTFFTHPYMIKNTFEEAFNIYSSVSSKLTEIQYTLTSNEVTHTVPTQYNNSRVSNTSLPKINLPTFDGKYQNWKSFKDLFTSLIIRNHNVSEVERMHYLKSCIKGDAEQLLLNMSVDGDSFDSAWTILIKRYEIKRFLVSTQLERLLKLTSCSRSAQSLNNLLNGVTQSIDALRNLGSPVQHWDQLLVQIILSRLDDKTLEDWEFSIGSSSDFPSLELLKEFINGHARALERKDAAHLSTSQPTSSKVSTQPTQRRPTQLSSNRAHVATSQPLKTQSDQRASQYPCDHCTGQHYIVTCPKFRELTPRQRLVVVKQLRLCFNCLGHHSVVACRNTKKCSQCSQSHHTMLHLGDGIGGSIQNQTQLQPPSQANNQPANLTHQPPHQPSAN